MNKKKTVLYLFRHTIGCGASLYRKFPSSCDCAASEAISELKALIAECLPRLDQRHQDETEQCHCEGYNQAIKDFKKNLEERGLI